jgi:hypothetical protein
MLSRIPSKVSQIREALIEVELDELPTDTLQRILRNLPTAEETAKLHAYSGALTNLGKPEQFLLIVSDALAAG